MTNNEPDKSAWNNLDSTISRRLVSTVNQMRADAGLTIRDVRNLLDGVGWPVSESTLNGILSGGKRRSFTVGELLAFARAFNVSPTALLVGYPPTAEVPIPGVGVRVAPLDEYVDWSRGLTTPDAVVYGVPNKLESRGVVVPANAMMNMATEFEHSAAALLWRNALWIAYEEYDDELIYRAIPPAGVKDDHRARVLILQLRVLAKKFPAHQAVGGAWEPRLPDPLAFILDDAVPVESIDQPMREVATENDLVRARKYIEEQISHVAIDGGVSFAAPTS